jgi:integrase
MALRFVRLARPSIRKLKPGEKITERGITAERLADADVRYSVNIMVDGERIHRVIGRESDGVTRTQAEEFIARAKTEAREGRLHLQRGQKLHLSFAGASEVYLRMQKEVGGKNLDAKARHIELHLKPYLGNMRLDQISTFTLEKLRKNCRDRGLSVGTINRILATYRHMSRKLLEARKVAAPMAMIKLEAEDNRREYVIPQEADAAIYEAAKADRHPYAWLFVKIGLGTSMRHREILSVRFENHDHSRRRLRVMAKGGRWREQPLSAELNDILKRESKMAAHPDGWIFPSKLTRSGHIESMDQPFARCVKAAGLDPRKAVVHSMRHTAITRLAATGADFATVQKFSGHRSVQMVMRYTHAQDKHVDKAIDMMQSSGPNQEPSTIVKLERS